MTVSGITTTLLVDQTPEEAFNAINTVRGWWSEEIEGSTLQLNDEFTYHYENVHRCKLKLTEVIPGKKVVWLVLDNYFNFTKDKSELKGTKICFEISGLDNKTQIRFSHLGLVPGLECYEICREGWNNYINNSLRNLIITGKGQPNPKDGRNAYPKDVSNKMTEQDYRISFAVNTAVTEVFSRINSVSEWWTEDMEGSSQKVDDEFTVHFDDIHVSTQKLIEVIPDKKVVWLVTKSKLNFIKDKSEWTGTKISFDLSNHDEETLINFTHFGLVPQVECYNACVEGWDYYIKGSLFKLLTEGKGMPG